MDTFQLKDVVLVTSDEKSLGFQWEDKASKISGVQVISAEYDLPAVLIDTKFIGLVKDKEQVFVKNPFANEYIEISQSENRLFSSKISIYRRVAAVLGAKTFRAKAVFVEEKKRTLDADLEASARTVELDATYKAIQEEKLNKTYELESDFESAVDFDRSLAYEQAKQLIMNLQMESEQEIVDLIENNNPQYQNREVRQRIKLQLTNELNDLLEISFKLTGMGSLFGLGANFQTTTESVKTIILDTEITF